MFSNAAFEVDAAPTWAPTGAKKVEADWRTVDRALRSIGKRRAGLDAEEARWLREAEALQIWRPLGMVSMLDYLERVLGYAPRAAQDRLRVARALGSLPELTEALARGELAFSAVRELTRVATPATEGAWVASARGKNLRQIEESVAHRKPGDRPSDPPDPEPRMQVVRFELSPETFALLRQARAVLNEERPQNLDEDGFVKAMCEAVLDGASTSEPTGCRRCQTGWQEGAGAQIVVGPEVVERAMCDAQHIGSIDGDGPARAHQDIPPSVVRFVWRRDGGRCRVPGCRSARALEVHHIVHRADGGTHDPAGLVLLCSSCHQAHHAGALAISGTAEQLDVRRPNEREDSGAGESCSGSRGHRAEGRAHVGVPEAVDQGAEAVPSRLDAAVLRTQAKQALVGMGWKPAIASPAVAAASAALGAGAALEQLIFEALRQCRRPIGCDPSVG